MNTMLDVFFSFLGLIAWDSCKYVVSCFFDCLHGLHGLHVLQLHGLHDGFLKRHLAEL